MPRAERPLDPGDGPLAHFAADLRLLRRKAGSPSYRELSSRAHYSSTTLADAASGRRLPSLAVMLAYVRACGAEPAEWEERWRGLAAELSAPPGPDPTAADNTGGPYVGLAAFGTGDADRFFGREHLVDELVDRVAADRFLAVFGASGSGKSSLLRAGLLARLEADPRRATDPLVLAFTPGPHPLEQCAAGLAAVTGAAASGLCRELRTDERALHLAVLQATADRPAGADALILVDQFEEVFTLCGDRDERDRFITALLTAAQAANSRARVVLGVRADFYPACSDHPRLVTALRDRQLLLGPMTAEELRRAISLPAARAGGTVESALLARIVADAGGRAGTLPLVSHALRETWRRRRGTTLTVAGYEAAGGLEHALANTAETLYQRLELDQRRLARGLFRRLVALGEGTEDTKRRVAGSELDADPGTRAVLEKLVAARLITLDAGGVELTHEALLRAWPRLRGWINENRAALRLSHQIGGDAATWDRDGRDDALLYRGSRLAVALDWAGQHASDPLLDGRIRDFLHAGSRQQRRAARLRRLATTALCLLTVLACATTAVAVGQRSDAQRQRDRAVAQQLLAEAAQVRGTDPSLAAQLTLASYRVEATPRARTDLLDTQHAPLSTALTAATQPVYAVAYSPDGRTMATGAGDDRIRLWDVSDPTRPTPLGRPLTGHTGWVYWLAFSPDGRTLASASRDRTARLWDVADRTHARPWGPPLTGHRGYVFSVSFSPDGHTLTTASYDHTVRLWDVTDPAHPAPLGDPLTGNTDSVASAASSPDGRTVASAGHDRTIRLWNVTDPAHPTPWCPPLTATSDTVYAVAFSPDGRVLASVGADRTVRLWDVSDPTHPTSLGPPLTGHTDAILAVAFSPDGRTLATGAADHTIRLWDLTDPTHPAPLGTPLVGHTGIVNWLAFSPNGHTLASASDDHTVRLWSLPGTALTGHTGTVDAVAFRPDGQVLASGGTDGTVRLWSVSEPTRRSAVLASSTEPVTRLAFRPDGALLAAAYADGTVRLWAITGQPVARTVIQTGAASGNALAFDPTGRLLATEGPGDTIRLWDLHDPGHPAPVGPVRTGQTSPTSWVGFSPDGDRLAATSADDTVRFWNTHDHTGAQPAMSLRTGDTDGILWASFDPTGQVLATAGGGHSVQLWRLPRSGPPAPLGQPLTGHTAPVTWVGFSPDGRTLASASTDQTLRLWDTTDLAHATALGNPLTAGHTGPLTAAAYDPAGRLLASASTDGVLELSSMDTGAAVRRVCAATTLTATEWHRYVPELPFTAPCR